MKGDGTYVIVKSSRRPFTNDTMISIPQMLMIGSTGRNSGKTTFAVEAIKRWKPHYQIIALKVTAIDKHGRECPRGGMGCGACSSLCGDYEIIEELDPNTEKDTSQLLKSGALRVFWLKSLRSNLQQGIKEFLSLIPSNTIIICESNSLRKSVKPGAFVILHNAENGEIKITAKDVWENADSVIDKDMREHSDEVLDNLSIEHNDGELSIRLTLHSFNSSQ